MATSDGRVDGLRGQNLEPFYESHAHQREDILLNELGAMDEGHVRRIARAHRLAPEGPSHERPIARSLMSLIMTGVLSHL